MEVKCAEIADVANCCNARFTTSRQITLVTRKISSYRVVRA
jgi:hypothetical protein